MVITLNNVQEDSKEAEVLKNAVRFYDHFAVEHADTDLEYWAKVRQSAINIEEMYRDTDKFQLMHEMIMGMFFALEYKAKLKTIDDM